jgi:hypothetical protein
MTFVFYRQLTQRILHGQSRLQAISVHPARRFRSTMSPLDYKNSVTAPSPLFAKHDPKSNPESTVQGDKYRFTVISDGCIRYEYSPDGAFEDRASTFAMHRNLPKPKFNVVRDDQGGLEIKTDRLHLQYDGKAFSASGLWCDCRAKSESLSLFTC